MNNTAIIGGLAIVGVGAYFLLSRQKEEPVQEEPPKPVPVQPPAPTEPEFNSLVGGLMATADRLIVRVSFRYRGPAQNIRVDTEVVPTGMASQGYYASMPLTALAKSDSFVNYTVDCPVFLQDSTRKVQAGNCNVWWAIWSDRTGASAMMHDRAGVMAVVWYPGGIVRGFVVG